MTNEEREKKHELLTKISVLVRIASSLGESIDDEQTRFIAETCTLVLMAGSDPETTLILSNHILNYLEEMAMKNGEKTTKEYLIKDLGVHLN